MKIKFKNAPIVKSVFCFLTISSWRCKSYIFHYSADGINPLCSSNSIHGYKKIGDYSSYGRPLPYGYSFCKKCIKKLEEMRINPEDIIADPLHFDIERNVKLGRLREAEQLKIVRKRLLEGPLRR